MDKTNIPIDNKQIERTIKKTKQKMTLRVIRICILCMAAVLFAVSFPNVLQTMQINRINKAQKAAMLTYQLSSPDNISGYSIESGGISYKRDVKLFYNNPVGKNLYDGIRGEIAIDYSLINGKLNMYYPIYGGFMHPSRYETLAGNYSQKVDENNQLSVNALQKNKDTTVALVDLSLAQSYSLDEIIKLTQKYDIHINWFAIETGYEGYEPPKNIGMPMQQYYTWGFPSQIYTPETIFAPATIEELGMNEYLATVYEYFDWLKDNDNLLANNIWFVDDDVYNSIKNNPIKCYGIQINGPTEEVCRLINDIEYSYIKIVDMGFWFW